MGLYQNNNGTLVPIAGRGKAEYGASTVRKGTAVGTMQQVNDSYRVTFTFDEPMPDSDYLVDLQPNDSFQSHPRIESKTKNGFSILVSSTFSTSEPKDITWSYTAFKLYTDTEYNNLNSDVNNIKNSAIFEG